MKKTLLLILGTFLFGALLSQSKTLELNPAAGDEFTSDNMTLTWSIGEGIIETFSNNEIILTQGFHQPTLKITQIDETEESDFQINVYPNPTSDIVQINFISNKEINCSAQLFDMSGKLLFSKNIKGTEVTENINLTDYSSTLYLLRIIETSGKMVKTYKIQRIK